MKHIKALLFYLFFMVLLSSCEAPPRTDGTENKPKSTEFITADEVSPDEEYVMITIP